MVLLWLLVVWLSAPSELCKWQPGFPSMHLSLSSVIVIMVMMEFQNKYPRQVGTSLYTHGRILVTDVSIISPSRIWRSFSFASFNDATGTLHEIRVFKDSGHIIECIADEACSFDWRFHLVCLREGQKRGKGLSKESHVKECDYFHAIRSAAVVKIKAGFVLMKSAAHMSIDDVSSA